MNQSKWIKEILTWEEFGKSLELLSIIIRPYKSNYRFIYGIPRGGLIAAVYLSHQLGIPLTWFPNMVAPPKNILIVDDIVDTGKTLKNFGKYDTASVYYKPRSAIKPTYYARESEDWIVFPYEREDEKENREP